MTRKHFRNSIIAAVPIMLVVGFSYRACQDKRELRNKEIAPVEAAAPETSEEKTAAVETPAGAPVPETTETSNVDQKVQILSEILNQGRDSDPRMDTDLKTLDSKTKQAFEQYYDDYAPEGRNARGTIVFLVGRNLNEKSDFDFMGRVLSETPCLSLVDCNREPEPGFEEDQAPTEIALNYPQVVALESLRRVIDSDREMTQKFRNDIEMALVAGSKSSALIIAERSQELLRHLNR